MSTASSGVLKKGFTQLNHPDGSSVLRSLSWCQFHLFAFGMFTYCGSKLLKKVLGEYTLGYFLRSTRNEMVQTAAKTPTGINVENSAENDEELVPDTAADTLELVELSLEEPILGSEL